MFQKLLRSLFVGIAFSLGVMLVPAFAGSIALFTGPAGTNPIAFPSALSDLNTLITTLNSQVFSYVSLNNSSTETGELAMLNSAAFSANGSVATVLGSVGPTGSHTSVQEWFTVIDSSGNVRYLPAF